MYTFVQHTPSKPISGNKEMKKSVLVILGDNSHYLFLVVMGFIVISGFTSQPIITIISSFFVLILPTAALVVATIACITTIKHQQLQSLQFELSITPSLTIKVLSISNDGRAPGIWLVNSGVGSAVLNQLDIVIGETIYGLSDAAQVDTLFEDHFSDENPPLVITATGIGLGSHIQAKDEIKLLALSDNEESDEIINLFLEKLSSMIVRIGYESISGGTSERSDFSIQEHL